MMRDVLVASIHRGQFPPALLGLVILAIVLKMPSEDVSKVLLRFLGLLERHEALGYVLAMVCAASWFFHSRAQRRWIGAERRRMAEERAEWSALASAVQNKWAEVHS